MRGVGPVYCETLLNIGGTYPAEPINTWTSLAPVIFGIAALAYLYQKHETNRVAYALAILTIFTGIGSVAWHAMRTEFTLIIDALPGVAYFFVFVIYWLLSFKMRYQIYVLASAILATVAVASIDLVPERALVLAAVLTMAVALLWSTWIAKRQAFGLSVLMVSSAMIALSFRSVDSIVCGSIPVGTHFLWHIFLGFSAYVGVRVTTLLNARD